MRDVSKVLAYTVAGAGFRSLISTTSGVVGASILDATGHEGYSDLSSVAAQGAVGGAIIGVAEGFFQGLKSVCSSEKKNDEEKRDKLVALVKGVAMMVVGTVIGNQILNPQGNEGMGLSQAAASSAVGTTIVGPALGIIFCCSAVGLLTCCAVACLVKSASKNEQPNAKTTEIASTAVDSRQHQTSADEVKIEVLPSPPTPGK